ncbi:hypothetical protein ILUMI_07640 [Ignelater luminosus]|uniref:Uncharacterized protein n=1 Tax=Ignelater luminosus TaxID=2038154 RepID=A0A8K0D332_IGNLU|nr:hypothetical protein ILUMI_07640 [Ignelater luminosus]
MMYPMVQQQQQQPSQERQQVDNSDVEQEASTPVGRHRSHKPLYRRFFNYVRQAWTGVKFALDSELEDLETPPRYRPDSLEALCRSTRFSEAEIKRIYRGFKAECPTGVVKEETFKMIYAQFFPQGDTTRSSGQEMETCTKKAKLDQNTQKQNLSLYDVREIRK